MSAPPTLDLPPLPPEQLRWRCDATALGFDSTRDVEPVTGVVGQETAIDALQFGLESRAAGQNVFVRGLTGTGRMTLVKSMLEEMRPTCPGARDRCYVHNFAHPDRPRLISLPAGQGPVFRRLADELADFIRDELKDALAGDETRAQKDAISGEAQERVKTILEPLEKAIQEAGLAIVTLQVGSIEQLAVFPLVDGKPVPPAQFEAMRGQGLVSDADYERAETQRRTFEERIEAVNREVQEVRSQHVKDVGALLMGQARAVLAAFTSRIAQAIPDPGVKRFLDAVVEDVVERGMHGPGLEGDFTRSYRVNVLLERDDACPIIVENMPTMTNLLGCVDREMSAMTGARSDHLMIGSGSLLRADGGYLIVEARDLLMEPGAWKVLIRTLRTGRLEIIPPEVSMPWLTPTLKPEPIDVDVKVVLLGDEDTFYALDAIDPDFTDLFKVLADFDSVIVRDDRGIGQYAGVLARILRNEKLPPFDAKAVAALVEHGARIASRGGKLTTRFGRLIDITREAAFIAGKEGRPVATGADVTAAIRRAKRRADLPSRRFRELLADGTIRVETHGTCVGQINGLAVLRAGPLTSGFPARITATIGPGTAGVINIEREAALSGAIHTKGFYILGGLLRFLLQTDHPLAFVASIAFEQSYGGIDGDSASGAEICCLLSALTEVPLRQDLAMTGAIDQMGHILAIGGVNEKIEGFLDVCGDIGLTGSQGVIIPKSNVGELMLREDVVDLCGRGRFHVYAVDTVHEAIEVLTGMPAGRRDTQGGYPEGTFLALAVERAHEYWLRAGPPIATVVRDGAAESASDEG